jgi:hypothetical protein
MEYKCPCGKSYTHRQSLHTHRKNCVEYKKTLEPNPAVMEVIKPATEQDIEHYKQLLEAQEKLLQEKDKLLEEKDRRIEEQKQTIEFMKSFGSTAREQAPMQQTPIKQEEPEEDEESNEEPEEPDEEPEESNEEPEESNEEPEEEQKLSFNLKEYLESRNPINVEEFFNRYIPTIEEFDNIISNGIVNATVLNLGAYAKSYGDQCPYIVTNMQYERLRLYVYEETKWIEYDRIHAQMYMKKTISRFVNKYFKYMMVFNNKYAGCMQLPSQLADDNADINKKNNLRMSLCCADNYADKISKEVAYELSVNRGK